MSDFSQKKYVPGQFSEEQSIFADNPDPRCAVVLLLDRSGSMSGAPIAALNKGLKAFEKFVQEDDLTARRAEIAIVSFGPLTIDTEFHGGHGFTAPEMVPDGDTPMGKAIMVGLDMLERRRQDYKANGIAHYKPMVLLITDGAPTDDWRPAAARIRAEEKARRVAFFAVGVTGADFTTLTQISVREPMKLDGLKFTELFRWLKDSMTRVSQSSPEDDRVALPSPSGWAAL